MSSFKLTAKQKWAIGEMVSSQAENVLFEGGSRSAKTFLHIRNIVLRALKAPGSRHTCLRQQFTDIKTSIVHDTFPKVMQLSFPKIPYNLNKTDWFVEFDNKAQIWFGGLDDNKRMEKILGNEYATIFLNECSQISNDARQLVETRLAQNVMQLSPNKEQPLPLRMYYDYNPPAKSHWGYKLFRLKQDPETRQPLKDSDNYLYIKFHPKDNKENLPAAYLRKLEGMSPRYKKRFWDGEYSDDNPNALFSDITIDQYRIISGEVPDFVRVVVAVDPSGSKDADNMHNDAIGIMVVGLGMDGNAYVIEDCTIKAGPDTWGKVAVQAYDRNMASCIVGENNYGGDMVRFTIQTAKPNVPYKAVTASRGKHVRAEPISALYEQGKVRHVGHYPELEDELIGFSTMGYLGDKSPNRADALIWAISDLFPGMVQPKKEEPEVYYSPVESWEAI